MAPSVFWPMPKVTSAIVRITVDPEAARPHPGSQYFHQFVKAIFLHRRKFLRANVVAGDEGASSKERSRRNPRRDGLCARHADRATRRRHAARAGGKSPRRGARMDALYDGQCAGTEQICESTDKLGRIR